MWVGFIPIRLDVGPDIRVLAVATAVAIVTAFLCGLPPALHIYSVTPWAVLSRNSLTVRGGRRLARPLITIQVALAFLLVVGAGQFSRSLQKLHNLNLGFRHDGVLTAELFENSIGTSIPNRSEYYRQLAAKLSMLPGIIGASYSQLGPIVSFESKELVRNHLQPDSALVGIEEWVAPGFFRLMGLRILAGRDFDWRDDNKAGRVVVLSQSLARHLFPNQDPIGRQVDIGTSVRHEAMTVIGVVAGARLWKPRDQNQDAVYMGLMQEPQRNQPLLVIRTDVASRSISRGVREVIRLAGHHYPLRIQTVSERMDAVLSQERILAALSGYFALLALLLSSLGLYGLVSSTVTKRTREFGIRIALGADHANILMLMIGDFTKLMVMGSCMGLISILILGKLLSSFLFGISPADPISIGSAVLTLTIIGLLAGYLPAKRTMRIDPVEALRVE